MKYAGNLGFAWVRSRAIPNYTGGGTFVAKIA